jgi:hypothetical protein
MSDDRDGEVCDPISSGRSVAKPAPVAANLRPKGSIAR